VSRTYIYSLLREDAGSSDQDSLGSLGLHPDDIYAAEAADDIKIDRFPFMVMRWGNISKGIGPSRRQLLDVWVHDRERDYQRIDNLLKRVESVFSSVVASDAKEGWITQIDWQGSSPDLRDDGYDTITRNSTFMVIASTR